MLGGVDDTCDVGLITDKAAYFDGNYYSDEKIAENNAKADRLLRKLRQWQALNDEPVSKKDWEAALLQNFLLYITMANSAENVACIRLNS